MSLTSTQRSILTCRIGANRIGAFRIGFTPRDTEGDTPGSDGGRYIWHEEDLPVDDGTVWTLVQD